MLRVFHYVTLALMQDAENAKRISGLSIRSGKVKVTGNIKFDQIIEESENPLTKEFRDAICDFKRRTADCCSKHSRAGRSVILKAFKEVWKNSKGKLPRLMIVPRHPERFKEVAENRQKFGI